MNRLFKRLLCGAVTASMVIGTLVLPNIAMAAEEPTIDEIHSVYDNNALIEETQFFVDGTEVFSLSGSEAGASKLTVRVNIKNYTLEDRRIEYKLYSVDGDDYERRLGEGTGSLAVPAYFDDYEDIEINISEIPEGTKKLIVKANSTRLLYVDHMDEGDGTASFTLHGSRNANLSTVKAYLAEYDSNNTLVSLLSVKPLKDEVIESARHEVTIPYTKVNAEDSVKLFVWDDMEPLDEIPATNRYEIAELYCGVKSPVAAPADSNSTTNGVHDPSIVKFPNDDRYFVYSSHHLIFTSTDLVNWKKYDFTNVDAKTISPKTAAFFTTNYTDTTMNGTYWAPDVIYKEGDAHPYWMYISVSCGLGGMNSAISLMKSDNPLFWADSSSDIVDAGIVYATKDKSGKTNAIDANIYYDSSDSNKPYFIWGSFWGGIQAVPLTTDGFASGVTYTSDSTILSTSKELGTSVFTQRGGAAGPEGAWMIEHGDYRYMFTSYGWLGSNYNTRVARAPKSTTFAANMGTQLVDANGTIMGTQYANGSKSSLSGYKLIGSYRLGDGTDVRSINSVGSYYYEKTADSAHIYYGPGHNSAINVGDESFYVSHTRKDEVEIAATLQVRKMLFTEDGWPVVSPVTYAKEVEQALPKEMIIGTYDLASVGKTKWEGSVIKEKGAYWNRNYDLPVLSSKVTLKEDGTMADGLGTWAMNTEGDKTVITLTFKKNGDESKDEFYKNGDVMTMYALYGYDKDEAEPVVALTGTDQKHITQFAKKSMAIRHVTKAEDISDETVTIDKSEGGNPELGFDGSGNILYAGDPAALVDGDTVYLYVGRDNSTYDVTDPDTTYVMPGWHCYSSKDMVNWKYEKEVMSCSSVSWASNKQAAWAAQVVKYNNKYYMYYCTWDKTSDGKQSIGVATSNSPTGPFVDKGSPLVKGTLTEPQSSDWNDIDPTVLIDTDENGEEHRYLAWGNGKYYICELNEDMISVKDQNDNGTIEMNMDIKEKPIKSMGSNVYTEAPWLYKRDGRYYLFFAANWREEMAYAMTDNPFGGRYDYIQTIMSPTATSNTNHPAVIDFGGKTYFIYHNGALSRGYGHRRSVCIEELKFDENGYVYPLTETSIGLTGTASVIKTNDGKYLGHEPFINPLGDDKYPLSVDIKSFADENEYSTAWEIMPAKAVPSGEKADGYVSIQSVDKPGLYIKAKSGKEVVLTQDTTGLELDKMTFKTVKGLDGNENAVSFKSVSCGKYLTMLGNDLTLSYGTHPAAASFIIDEAEAKPNPVIDIAEVEEDEDIDPEEDITQDFNVTTATLISLNASSGTPYTALDGVTLYMGSRDSDFQPNQNFAIQSGGVSGNALVLNTGKYQSSSRGPRMQIYTPAIPNGYTVTAQIKVKQGKDGSVLRYNDSTSSENGTNISGLSTSWQTLEISIKNEGDYYARTIKLGDNAIASDYTGTFPVLWGTTENSKGESIYFDDLTIKTTDKDGETPVIVPPESAAKFEFEDNLTDSVSGTLNGILTGSLASQAASVENAAYTEGKNGKAISFSGEGSYGVELPVKPSGKNYTISFDTKITASTTFTPMVFLMNYDSNGAAKTEDTNAQWISIASQGWKASISDGPMIWSRDVTGGNSWNDLVKDSNNSLATDNQWHNVTVVATGATGKIYVDKALVAEGNLANIIDDTTKIFLAVNYWNTPFNGAIDNFILYNKALSAAQVAKIGVSE